jgi:AraC family transcriptional activator of tynA and feaB
VRFDTQMAGGIVLYDGARPFVYDFSTAYRILLVKVPRRVMLSRLPEAERLTAVTVDSQTPLGSLACSVILTAAELDLPGDVSASAKVGSSLVDILAAVFETEAAGHRELCDRQAGLLKRAKDYMRSRLDEPELDVDRIANALYVSPRTLSRAFASEGTTVIRWLWKERLETSYVALSGGRAKQVTDLALGCGFASGSHFSRMFKATYGVLPHCRTAALPHCRTAALPHCRTAALPHCCAAGRETTDPAHLADTASNPHLPRSQPLLLPAETSSS